MALKHDLAKMKKYINEQLGFDAGEESGLDDLSKEEIEDIYEELMEQEKQTEKQAEPPPEPAESKVKQKTEPQSAPQPKERTKRQPQRKTRKTKVRSEMDEEERRGESLQTPKPPDPLTQYRLFIQQAHDMASEWAQRLGEGYTPFVESSEHGFYYGAVHRLDSSLTQFSEIHLPSSLVEQLSLPKKAAKTGTVYRWALAEYKKLLGKAESIKENSDAPKDAYIEETRDYIIVYTKKVGFASESEKEDVIMIPEKIKRILNE